jgi:hypothetical protein
MIYITATPRSRRIQARTRSTSPTRPADAVAIADDVRLRLGRRDDERVVGLGERVAQRHREPQIPAPPHSHRCESDGQRS